MYRASPFDSMAADYDQSFTTSAVGERMRAAVWRRLDVAFQPGERVLELNCGTGEDAIYLGRRGVRVLATDRSIEMLAIASAKAAHAGLTGMVDATQLAIEDLAHHRTSMFDGALSTFGGLNCVRDLSAVARGLAASLRPGAPALLCVMGPAVPWEWGWYLVRGRPRKALRRLRRGGTGWRGLRISYPSIGAVRQAFAPYFVQRRVAAIGALVPGTFAEPWAARHPRMLAALDSLERFTETAWPLPWLADHFLIELERA